MILCQESKCISEALDKGRQQARLTVVRTMHRNGSALVRLSRRRQDRIVQPWGAGY